MVVPEELLHLDPGDLDLGLGDPHPALRVDVPVGPVGGEHLAVAGEVDRESVGDAAAEEGGAVTEGEGRRRLQEEHGEGRRFKVSALEEGKVGFINVFKQKNN